MKLDTKKADARPLAASGVPCEKDSFAAEYVAFCRKLLEKNPTVIWRNLNPAADPAAAGRAVGEKIDELCQSVCNHMTDWLYSHNGAVGQWPHPDCGAALSARFRREKPVGSVDFGYFGAPVTYDAELCCLAREDPWLKPRVLQYTGLSVPERPLARKWDIFSADREERQPYIEKFRQEYKQETEEIFSRWNRAEDDYEAACRRGETGPALQQVQQEALRLRQAYARANDMAQWRARYAAFQDTDGYRAASKSWEEAKAWTAGHNARVAQYLATMRLRDEKRDLCTAWQQAWLDYLRLQGLPVRAELVLEEGGFIR